MNIRLSGHRLKISLATALSLVPILFAYQNCTSGGFSADAIEEPLKTAQAVEPASCAVEVNGTIEKRPVGSTETGYLEESVDYPAECQKVTRSCGETGQWNEPLPAFQSCKQLCLNPATAKMEACPSNPKVPKPITDFPSWRKGMKVWEWKKLEGSDLSLVTPNVLVPGSLSSRIDNGTGLAADTVTNKIYSAANGGDADYAGNEVYEMDLSSENPSWRLLREPTPADSISASDSAMGIFSDYYRDNRPSSTRTYYGLQFISAKQSIFKFGAGSLWGTGNEGNVKTDSYSIPFNDWSAPGTWPDIYPERSSTRAVSVCKNPLTEEVYINLDRIRKFNPSTGSYSALAAPPDENRADDDADGGCAVDTKRKKILFFKNSYSPDGGLVYDIQTDTLKSISFAGPALRDVRDAVAGYGYYDPAFDVYIFKDHKAGGRIFRIHPETFEAHQILTSGGEEIPEATNGVYTRFSQIPNLKGYLYYPKYGSGAWFLATE